MDCCWLRCVDLILSRKIPGHKREINTFNCICAKSGKNVIFSCRINFILAQCLHQLPDLTFKA